MVGLVSEFLFVSCFSRFVVMRFCWFLCYCSFVVFTLFGFVRFQYCFYVCFLFSFYAVPILLFYSLYGFVVYLFDDLSFSFSDSFCCFFFCLVGWFFLSFVFRVGFCFSFFVCLVGLLDCLLGFSVLWFFHLSVVCFFLSIVCFLF